MLCHKCGFRSENKSVSIPVFKGNNAEEGPLAKEKRLEEVSTERPGKVKASDEDTINLVGERFPMALI